MEFSEIARKYLFVFFILGQSSYNPRAGVRSEMSTIQILYFIPSTIYLFLTLLLSFIEVHGIYNYQFTFDYVIYVYFILSKIVTCFVILTSTPFFNKYKLKKLWSKFESMEQCSTKVLQLKWSFVEFERMYKREVWITILFFFGRLLCKLMFRDDKRLIWRHIRVCVLNGFSLISILHILFYVELLSHMLKSTNASLIKTFRSNGIFQVEQTNRNSVDHAYIEIYKRLHFSLWQITQLIKINFGWILVINILQFMSNLIHPVYWIIVNLHEDDISTNFQILSMCNNLFISLFI